MLGAVIQEGARSVRDKFARCPAQRCRSGRRVSFWAAQVVDAREGQSAACGARFDSGAVHQYFGERGAACVRLTFLDVIERGLTGKVDVFVDGKKVSRCIEADDEAGYVVCWQTDEQGNAVLGDDGFPKTVRLDGRVEIRIRDSVVRHT